MIEALRWSVTVAISVAISFALSQAVRLITATYFPQFLAGQGEIIQFMTFFSALLCSLGVGIAIQARIFVHQSIERIQSDVRETVEAAIEASLLSAVYGPHADALRSSRVFSIFSDLISQLKGRPPGILLAAKFLIERDLPLVSHQVEQFFSAAGTEIDISDHVRITRALCEGAHSYVEIQRRAFNVPDEWTTDWCQFLDDIRDNPSLEKKYVVLMRQSEIKDELEKLRLMDKYLARRKVKFSVCEIEQILDSFGGQLPTDRVIEMFDRHTIKAAALPGSRYRGGITLLISIFDASKRTDLVRYVDAVNIASKSVEEYETA